MLIPTAARPDQRLRSHCPFCSMQCSLDLHLAHDPTAGYEVKPSPDFPVATGRLCQKGFNALAHTVHPERVLQPLRKSKASSPGWLPAAWPEALNDIAARIRRIQEQYGPDSVAVFGGGSLTNEVCYLLGKFTRVALRSRYVDYNGRYCMSSAAAAQQLAFGIDRGLPFPLEDIPQADYLILAGTNIAECQPTLMPYLLAAKKKGAVIVTIDPRRTMTSKIAAHQLMIEPGQDSLLVSGLLHVILEEKLYDAEFVTAHTEGVEAVQEAVRDFPPERVAALTGIPEDTIREVARGFAGAKRGMVLTARGLEQQVNGVEHTLQYINLCLLCGHIGQPGSGFGSVTGQANGQGGREHGLKADQLPGYRSIEDPDARAHVAQVWGIDPHELPGKGVSAYELFGKILDGDIKAMMILGSNPVVSSPNNARVAEALAKLDLLVVVDLFETETAAYADWLLPGTSFLEVEGTMTNLEGRVFYRPRVFEPAGAAMPDAWLLCALAERLGRGRYFSYSSMSEVFDELCRASAGGKADYSGISYSRLQEAQGLFWPCPGPGQSHPGTPRLFAGGVFPRAGGRARLHAVTPQPPAETADTEYPYLLTTGRLGGHYLSGAQTRRTDALAKKAPEPVAELHPALAEQLRLREGDRVRLTSRRGSLEVAAKVTKDIHPRTMFVPFHWGGDLAVNRLTNDALHPISRMPEFKISAVRAERVEPEIADSYRNLGTDGASWSNARDSGEVEYTPVQHTASRTAADPAGLAASRPQRS
ncbi:assimilatory nitrate reductase (NADH) alpha subunit apoprotein [Paenibacillus barengoltzii]|uniref:molybdopterin oxidoreductase family protein n=1 Tax=Paenibacillus barengoltzii TaxID=343517 RepID=UPI000A08CF97|nr:molybdopterin oxidoreductase family protein [Paenibacillus barengoltzii]SMF03907.1 assimilatory nitrate reductase (NADH) alpha subunit apoprotein [Paenibacillus barengoltzii]